MPVTRAPRVVTPGLAQGSAEVPVEEFTLDNGMKFLLVQRPELTTVSAGWVCPLDEIVGLERSLPAMQLAGNQRRNKSR